MTLHESTVRAPHRKTGTANKTPSASLSLTAFMQDELERFRKSHAPSKNLSESEKALINGALGSLMKLREKSISDKGFVFTSLAHHLSYGMLYYSFLHLRKEAAPGTDGMTVEKYEQELSENLSQLRYRIMNDEYRFSPVKRTYIPKASGGKRPLGICILEDKIVQGAVKMILEAIYEPCFAGISYGFRPVTRAHDALDALAMAIDTKEVNFVLDADIVGCFDNINKDILMEILKLKIGDRRILRLIRRMLLTGVLDKGILKYEENGVVQGSIISPILANIFLDYILDKFFIRWRAWELGPKGFSCMIRYADDFICAFETRVQAERYLEVLKDRLLCAGLRLHERKTRLIRFGRKARRMYDRTGKDKPLAFSFLGFEHKCGLTLHTRRFKLLRHTASDRIEKKIKEVKTKIKPIILHGKVENAIRALNQFLNGYYAYFAVHDNLETLATMRYRLMRILFKLLNRRSQRPSVNWEKFNKLFEKRIVIPHLRHDYPSDRFYYRQRWLWQARLSSILYAILQPRPKYGA